MHEMALALEIGGICERELAHAPESRLTGLGVQVGAFSGVEVDTLRFCLEVVLKERHGDVAIEIEREPGVAACLSCEVQFEVRAAPFECPDCGSVARGVTGGQSLQVSYLEVE
ncbi:MAG: hydrogenase maturation nickel metallochaperone HypA [Gemmatimonadetes bacterium]|uniref:Hydrogenase maturation nickel metallochaperone HypA n=1 Tax=Candidatus Kutchimonas denitrificans TaxID=3056748 RepID=A0AAE4ZC24_9BACT|nr:hydrogenase maturation nickel metallochaperone HypA [Gemmatimonadota bacterium]NIR74755.1 hydrogenase maturation nickel metallochaperone HypA [Candidatus Kutchimonas denitrificans]NIS01505.1 hydrogenase maturation nickel metallochaperone HypA [Gemmatimonadota bacterium]NIT67246.1 hydrogenase maturation nickel metallochaperone HypA [Gemmatimonadota bacterium]NIU52420.1 hydrogenase maturation nickel metallochaperone HypA [Gemmatimonadota bacterium]